jgi:hypothetical protein
MELAGPAFRPPAERGEDGTGYRPDLEHGINFWIGRLYQVA